MIIAIDGPAGSGKSTIAREVAKRLGMRYLDTGAMYRAATLLALEAGLGPDRLSEAGALTASADLRFEAQRDDLSRVYIGEREVSREIRGPLVSKNVSAVSAEPSVRRILTQRQRDEARDGHVVVEGRDMGTVVFPEADTKIFLTASVEERARRRRLQLEEQGVAMSTDQLIRDITERDALDSRREVAPLRKAEDAVEVDTTSMGIEEVIDRVCAIARDVQRRALPRWRVSRVYKGPSDTFTYRLSHVVLGPLWRFFYRIRVIGVDNFPLTGPVVVACNHKAMTDPFFLGSNAPRQIHYMAKVELWKFKPLGWAMNRYGTFPVNRGEVDRAAIKKGIQILDEGGVLGLFPEGHCYKAPGLGELRAGISLFSLRDGVVTVPAVMRGTNLAFKRGLPHFPKIDIIFGQPIDMPGADVPRADRARVVTERVREVLETLLATPVAR